MNTQKMYIPLGNVKIYGPTAREKRCNIFVDLAALFGCKFSKDTASKLQSEWKKLGYKVKLDIDSESDFVSIFVSKSTIVELAVLINHMSNEKILLDKELIDSVRKEVKKWKAPDPFQWEVGDIFHMALSKNLTAYGQVLGKTPFNAPTCVLFEYFTETPTKNFIDVLKARALAILHVNSDHLDNQNWVVIGNANPILSPGSGSCGEWGAVGSRHWDGLETLAKAWCSIKPWNDWYKEDFLDDFLLSGINKPHSAILLTRPELETLGIKRPEWLQPT